MQAHTKSMKSREEMGKKNPQMQTRSTYVEGQICNLCVCVCLLSVENIRLHRLISAKSLNVLHAVSYSSSLAIQ